MITIRFRLVKLGVPNNPVKVFVLREDPEGIIFTDFDLAVPVSSVDRLEAVEIRHLPASMICMTPANAPITLLPVQEATGDTVVAAMANLIDVVDTAYGEGLPEVCETRLATPTASAS